VLRERGQREVFCGLTGIVWLHRKIQDAFFLVVGSRTCAHLLQSAAGVMIFAEPRFATAIIDERDLAGLADAHDELDRVVSAAGAPARDQAAVPGGSCPSEVIKLDLSRAAQRLSQAPAAVRGAELFGQRHRDHLHAGRGRLPGRAGAEMPAPPRAPPTLLVVGTLADVVEDQFRACSTQLGIGPVQFFPPRAPATLPASARTPAAAGPALPGRHRPGAGGARRARLAGAPFPLGAEGTDRLAAGRRHAFGVAAGALSSRPPARPRRARAAGHCARHAPRWPGKRIFFFPDSQLELPLARFLSRELGMQLVEVGTPYLHRSAPGRRAGAAARRHHAVRRPARRDASSTAAAPPPDSWSAAWAWPTRWRPRAWPPSGRSSWCSRPIQGFEQAADLAELFARPLLRRHALARLRPDMQLTLWTYEGPPHVGAMRIATAMRDVHYVLHAPQGDTYADLLFTMIERSDKRPPVTYTTFQARDLGGDTAELFKTAAREAYERFQPKAMLVGASCTAELIQDDPGGLAKRWPADPGGAAGTAGLPAQGKLGRRRNLLPAGARAAGPARRPPAPPSAPRPAGQRPRCNLLGPTALGFRHRDDVREITRPAERLGIDVQRQSRRSAPAPADLRRLGEADFNVVLYPEIAGTGRRLAASAPSASRTPPSCRSAWAPRATSSPRWRALAGVDAGRTGRDQPRHGFMPAARASRWVCALGRFDLPHRQAGVRLRRCHHAVAAARVAATELGFTVVGPGHLQPRVRARGARGRQALRCRAADHRRLPAKSKPPSPRLQPELVLGTQMERHIAKRLGVPCAVISAPVHVQDFPRATRRRWASKAPTCCSTPGCTR
jgi:light-independent protochlorophyllide reductase subunit B